MFLGSVSPQQRFEVTDIKALGAALRSRTDRVVALRQISVTAPCYSSVLFRRQQETPSSRREGVPTQRREAAHGGARRGRESASPSAPLFMCFLLPLGLPCADWPQPGVLSVPPEVLTPVLGHSFDLPLFYFRRLFPSLPFNHHHFGLLFPILTT